MRRRGLVGLLVVAFTILAGRAVVLAQRAKTPAPLLIGPAPAESRTAAWSKPGAQVPQSPPADRAMVPAEVPPANNDDPMAAVDEFLGRNRKEADESIKALAREAETLRARLQKVEAALARWQSVSNALNQDAPQAASGPDQSVLLESIPTPPTNDIQPPPERGASGPTPPPDDGPTTPPPTMRTLEPPPEREPSPRPTPVEARPTTPPLDPTTD